MLRWHLWGLWQGQEAKQVFADKLDLKQLHVPSKTFVAFRLWRIPIFIFPRSHCCKYFNLQNSLMLLLQYCQSATIFGMVMWIKNSAWTQIALKSNLTFFYFLLDITPLLQCYTSKMPGLDFVPLPMPGPGWVRNLQLVTSFRTLYRRPRAWH